MGDGTMRAVRSAGDIAAVARLAREIWREHFTPIIGRAQVEYMLERFQSARAIAAQLQASYAYYLLTHEGEAAGYMAIVPDPGGAGAMLSKIYVRKALRGRGLGKVQLDFAKDLCRRRGIRSLWLNVNKQNTASIAWYERMGFRKTGPLVQDIGGGFVMDDYRMELDLGDAGTGGAGPRLRQERAADG